MTDAKPPPVFSKKLIGRLALGWLAGVVATLFSGFFQSEMPYPLAVATLLALVLVIVVCSVGVVVQAEALARLLGDPYGTLILSVSIALIEVILIAAVMLGPGIHATIARDSIMAVTMIIMNLIIGVAILLRLRHAPEAPANRQGVARYLGFIAVLQLVAFYLPNYVGADGEYRPAQMALAGLFSFVLYAVFLYLQMGPWSSSFQEVEGPDLKGLDEAASVLPRHEKIGPVLAANRGEVAGRTLALVLLMIPVVVLSNDMAYQLDRLVSAAGAPVALSGLLIAAIVFFPETLTTFRAARRGEPQRVSNLTHGALLSTMGITIPVVFGLGLAASLPVVTGESSVNLLFLAATLLLTLVSYKGKVQTRSMGIAHITLFALFFGSLFLPTT